MVLASPLKTNCLEFGGEMHHRGRYYTNFCFFPLLRLLFLILRNLDIKLSSSIQFYLTFLYYFFSTCFRLLVPFSPDEYMFPNLGKSTFFFLEIRNRSFNLFFRVQTHVTSGHQFRICTLLSAIYLLIIHYYSMCDVTKALYASTVWPIHATK